MSFNPTRKKPVWVVQEKGWPRQSAGRGGFYGVSLGGSKGNRTTRRTEDAAGFDEDDAPELDGRDINQMAATGELNLRTWLDD